MKLQSSKSSGKIKIMHHQTIKQSHAYQSAEMTYGVEFEVRDSELAIKKGIKRAERIVENALSSKFNEHQDLLKSLGKANS